MPADRLSESLSSITRSFNATHDLPTLTGAVRRAARALTDADGVTFVMREGAFCHYVDEDAIAPLWKGQRFPLDACISGWVMREDCAAVIPDIYADGRIPHDAYRATFVRSLVMMPVRTTEPIAAIGAYWAAVHTATRDEIHALHRIAECAALALENIELRTLLESERRARRERGHQTARPRGDDLPDQPSEFPPLMTWISDASGRIQFVNRLCAEYLGLSAVTANGANWLTLVHQEDVRRHLIPWQRGLRTGTPFVMEGRVRHADGGWRHVASYVVPRFGPDGRVVGMIGCSPDVTDITRAVCDASAAARRKDEFIASVVHELRQPLHAAVAALELLRGTEADRSRGRRSVSVLGRQLDQLTRMVNDLVEASRIVGGAVALRKEIVDLREILDDAVETVRTAFAERHLDFAASAPAAPVVVEADATRLRQVLVNVLSNAAKYTPPDGQVRLITESASREAIIRVRDSGVGIPKEDLTHIFDLFVRVAHRTEPGLGVGLAIARKFVELHGGTIAATSDGPGMGSEFVVRLPTVVTGSTLATGRLA